MTSVVSRAVKRGLYPVVTRLFAHVTRVEGRLKKHGTSFRGLFVGNSQFGEYLQQRLFDPQPEVIERKRIWIPSLGRILGRQPAPFDLCVAVLPKAYDRMFSGRCDYKTTENVRQVIDTSGSWDDVRKRLSKTKRQISNNFEEKHGLGHRISRDPGDFDFFYHRMFVPHIRRKFGTLASIDPYDEMKRFFLKGMLLFVTRDGSAAAGALCVVKDNVLEFRRTGVLDGDDTLIAGGAQTALYYFQLRYANAEGLRAVDTMMSAPFLNDGVYLHKREWGATVRPDDDASSWVYLFNAGPSEAIAAFFEISPMIAYGPRGLEGIVGAPGMHGEQGSDVGDLLRRWRAAGLQGFRVVTKSAVLNCP